MDAAVISALISAGVSVATFFIGTFTGRENAQKKGRALLYRKQMQRIYEPLMKHYEQKTLSIEHIQEIIMDNYALAPDRLLKEYRAARPNGDDLEAFSSALIAYFHWTKKQLGYQYESKYITPKYFPDKALPVFVLFMVSMLVVSGGAMLAISRYLAGSDYETGLIMLSAGGLVAWPSYLIARTWSK